MAITVPGSGSSATTSVTIPTHAVGDMIVIAARGTVAPTAPAAGGTVPTWTTPTNGSGVNNSVGWRIATTIATATNHTSGTWTSAAQMHVLILRRTGSNTLAVGDSPAQGGANNTQTMIYPAFTLTASKVSNIVIRYGARGTADTEVRTDGAFTTGGTWHTEQPATTPTSAVFSKVVTASEGTFTATPAGTNAAYRCGTLEITETAASVPHSQPVNDAIAGTDASAKGITSSQVDVIAGVDVQFTAVTSPQADAATVTDAIDPQLVVPAFSPDDIAGLTFWLKADAIGGLSDNDTVSTWDDSSPANHDMTASGAPSYQTNELNGHPVIRFDGVDDRMLSTSFSVNQPNTLFVVAKYNAAFVTPNYGLLDGLTSFSRYLARISSTQLSLYAGSNVAAVTTTPQSWHIYAAIFNGASSSLRVDGGTASTGNPGTPAGAGLSIAAAGFGTQFSAVDIAEVIVYDSALVDADRQDVEAWLEAKYFPPGDEYDQPVDDSIAGTDAQAKAVASTKADAAAGTDAQAKSVIATKADAIVGTDARTVTWSAARSQPDAVTGTDAHAKATTHPQADAVAGTDAISKAPRHPVADAIAGTDTQTRRSARMQADAIAGADAKTVSVTRPQADTATTTDATARVWAAKLALADDINATDDVDTSAVGANEEDIDDAAVVTDAVTRSTQTVRAPADAIAGTDDQAKRVTRPQADAITGTDARARAWAAKLTIADGLAVTDSIDTSAAGATEETVDDAAIVTDAITVSLGLRRTIGDSFAATDARVTQADYVRQPADVLTAADVVARAWAIIEAQADGLTVTDAVNARIPPSRWDMDAEDRWPPDTDEDWLADTDEDWEAQTDDRWLVSAEGNW